MSSREDQHLAHVNRVLLNFAKEGLKPNAQMSTNAGIIADKVFKLLQQKSKYKLDRVIIGGSFGKRTAISLNFDVDCVVFINNQHPPFEKVISDFEEVLMLADAKNVKTTDYSVQFTWDEIEFDFLPATNLGQDLQVQWEKTVVAISNDPRKSYAHSSSLVEAQIEFMRRQDAFAHELVRLCKYWNKTLYFEEYISGRSTIMELIAVHSAAEETKRYGTSDRSILRAFRSFLEKIKNFNNLDIHFEMKSETWIKQFATDAYRKMNHPIIQEPANPYNNLAGNLKPKTLQVLRRYAEETIRRLQLYFVASSTVVFIPLEEVFEPQVDPSYDFLRNKPFPEPQCIIGTHTGLEAAASKSLIVRKEPCDKTLVEIMKKYMDFVVKTKIAAFVNSGKPNLSTADVQETVGSCISKYVYGGQKTFSPSHARHEDYDMTFSIPYKLPSPGQGSSGAEACLKISFQF